MTTIYRFFAAAFLACAAMLLTASAAAGRVKTIARILKDIVKEYIGDITFVGARICNASPEWIKEHCSPIIAIVGALLFAMICYDAFSRWRQNKGR